MCIGFLLFLAALASARKHAEATSDFSLQSETEEMMRRGRGVKHKKVCPKFSSSGYDSDSSDTITPHPSPPKSRTRHDNEVKRKIFLIKSFRDST